MRFRALSLAVALVLSPAAYAQGNPRSFEIQRKDQGFVLSDRCPTGDFQIELRLNLTAAGSVLDTVGLDAAPRGSWSLALTAEGNLAFSLWDGRSWSQLLSSQPIKLGQATLVTLRRVADKVTLRLDTGWSEKSLPTPLSGQAIYVGDFLPDAHWGPKFNIHQGAIGRVEILYVGAPKIAPATVTDYSARIVDEQGDLNSSDRQRLETALRDLKTLRGIDGAIAFLKAPDKAAGDLAMGTLAHRLIAEGKLPQTYALFGYGLKEIRLYYRSNDLDKILPMENLRSIWMEEAKVGTPPKVLARTLAILAGKPQPGQPLTPAKPTAPVAVAPAATGTVRAEIGKEGGKLSSGAFQVEVPAGAMLRPDTLVMKPGAPSPFGVTGISVEFAQGAQTLLKPASIEFPIPAGADPKNLVALRSLGDKTWVTMPVVVDAGRGVAVAKTNHFCDTVLLDLGRTTVKIIGGISATVGGTLVLAAVGAAPVTSGMSLLVAVPFFVAGWALGGAEYDKALREGLVGPYPCPGFSIFWDPAKTPAEPYLNALIDQRNGNLVTFTRDSREPAQAAQPRIGPATSAPRETFTYQRGSESFTVSVADLRDLKVPVSVLGVASELSVARRFYLSLGVETPPSTTVYVYDRVGKSNDQEKATNSGLWDGVVLGINAKSLNAMPPNSADSRSGSAHEYWHAVRSYGRLPEMWLGTEEATAVALESLVWASQPGTAPDKMMRDFLGLHAWHQCSPVLRSGLFNLGPDEVADTRGYKQWPLLKFIYHVYGKAALAEVAQGRTSRAKLLEMFTAFAQAAFTEDQVVPDPATLSDHPVVTGALSVTGFKDHILTQDRQERTLRFGENQKPKATPFSINAYVVPLPPRAANGPPSPLVVRRRRPEAFQYPVAETIYAGMPSTAALGQPKRSDVKIGERFIVLPATWDVTPGSLPLMFLGGMEQRTAGLSTDAVGFSMGPSNPILVYRLAPPMDVRIEHLPTVNDADAKSRFTWTPPALGGTLTPAATVAAYRLYGRKAGGTPELIVELALKLPEPPDGWYQAPSTALKIDPAASFVDVPIARSKAITFDEFAMCSVDGLMKASDKPLESPVGWTLTSKILEALAKCTAVSFTANLGFVGTTTTTEDNKPPQVTTATFPLSGAYNAPNDWGFHSGGLTGGKLTITGGNFNFTCSRDMKYTGPAVSAGSMEEAYSGSIPLWPLSSATAMAGVTTVSLSGQVAPDGRLVQAAMKITHPNFGCAISFRDLVPNVVKIEGERIQISYLVRDQEATAKSSGHSAWMHTPFPKGASDFKMTSYNNTRSITLNFLK